MHRFASDRPCATTVLAAACVSEVRMGVEASQEIEDGFEYQRKVDLFVSGILPPRVAIRRKWGHDGYAIQKGGAPS